MSKPERTLTCLISGLTFTYSGKGRPPKYHPTVKGEALKAQRKARAAKKSAK
jgi:hypothetical protein